MSGGSRIDDLLIAIAYFSIPIQIVVALCKFPRLQIMPWKILILAILFVLFIFLCGMGHLLRYMDGQQTTMAVVNSLTAMISLTTALYLIPLIPTVLESLDKTLVDSIHLEAESESKRRILNFMSFLCHEMRNPLFAVTANVTFLQDDRLSFTEEQQSGLDCIAQSADLMLRLCNDVLDISKLESGKMELENHGFDLRQLMDGIQSVKNQIQQKRDGKVKFEYSICKQVPQVVMGDSARLLQIAYNLLSNAAKFTEEGYIKYDISQVPYSIALERGWITEKATTANTEDHPATSSKREKKGKDQDLVVVEMEEGNYQQQSSNNNIPLILKIRVQDSGPGIEQERLKTIFEPYAQNKLSDFRKHGGTGLGLSILDRITKLMNGSIHVESTVGVGSTFTAYVQVEAVHRSLSKLSSVALSSCASAREKTKQEICTSLELIQDNFSQSSFDDDFFSLDILEEEERSESNETHAIPPSSLGDCQQQQQQQQEIDNRVVLVVEDNLVNRRIVGKMLSHFNIKYKTAIDGQRAVDFMKQSQNYTNDVDAPMVGMILMDWSMPVMNGSEAIQEIRSRLGLTDVPIVALTACALEDRKQDLLQSGANEFATKPIMREDLRRTCEKYMGKVTTESPGGT